MQRLGVPLKEGHRKLSRWLGFPHFWSGLVAAWIFTGHAPSGRGNKGGARDTPGGWFHTVSASLSLSWFTLAVPCSRAFQCLPRGLIHQKRQSILDPYRGRAVNRPVMGLDRSSKWGGLSSDKVGSKKKLASGRSSIVPEKM